MGPFMDAADAVTPETGVTLGTADQAEVLKADGAATVTMAGTFAAVTGADGWYDYTCAAGDVDTVGEVVFVVQDTDVCLPVFVRGQVIEEAVYDAMYAASAAGPLQSTVAGRTLDVTTTGVAGVDFSNIDGVLQAADLAADCITAAKLADDCISSDQLAATAVTDIWAKVCESEGSYTAQQIMSVLLSVAAGVTSSGGAVFEPPNGTGTRVSATVNASNERTAMALTPSS